MGEGEQVDCGEERKLSQTATRRAQANLLLIIMSCSVSHAKPVSAITGIRLFVWQLAMRASLHDAAPERKRMELGLRGVLFEKGVCRAGGGGC